MGGSQHLPRHCHLKATQALHPLSGPREVAPNRKKQSIKLPGHRSRAKQGLENRTTDHGKHSGKEI